MAVLSVTEFTQIGMDAERGQPQAAQVDENTIIQNVTFTTTAAIANALNAKTRMIRVVVDTNAFVKIAAVPTATTSHMLFPAGIPEYFTVGAASGLKVAAVAQ